MSISRPQEFFRTHCAGGKSAIEALYKGDAKTCEEDWLDCKGCERIDDTAVKKTWSESLSAFANTQGGVLIWGLDARKDPETGIDRVTGPSYVPDVHALASRLRELTALACDPPLPGVEIVTVEDAARRPAGFVLCYIPEGDTKPYRAEQAGRNYFIRAGAATHVPSPALLRSLFFPQCKAVLSVHARVAKIEDHKYSIVIAIRNTGVATARDVLFAAQVDDTARSLGQLEHSPPWQPTMHPAGAGTGFYAFYNEHALHPGLQAQTLTYVRNVLDGEYPRNPLCRFFIALYCENNAPATYLVEYSRDEIEDRVQKTGTRV